MPNTPPEAAQDVAALLCIFAAAYLALVIL